MTRDPASPTILLSPGTPPLNQLLIRYSPTFHLIDEVLTKRGIGGLTPLAQLRESEAPFPEHWNRAIMENYFDTLETARCITGAFGSKHCASPAFLFFYQPYQVPPEFMPVHEGIREKIAGYSYGHGLSDTFTRLGMDVFTDIVHVRRQGREAIAGEMEQRLTGNPEFLACSS